MRLVVGSCILVVTLFFVDTSVDALQQQPQRRPHHHQQPYKSHDAAVGTTTAAGETTMTLRNTNTNRLSRREWLLQPALVPPLVPTASMIRTSMMLLTIATIIQVPIPTTSKCNAVVAEFAPGGTLITNKSIGILVNNIQASPDRKVDNANVLFDKDYYYKFGTGLQFIAPPGNTSFPKTMPFTKVQQRYDVLKKYRERIISGLNLIQSLSKRSTDMTTTTTTSSSDVVDPKGKEDVYQLRAMGLLANGLLASDNNGLPNEVFVARYYINEVYLRIDELRRLSSTDTNTTTKDPQLLLVYECIENAINSYLTLMNRVITTKVGEPFPYVQLTSTSK
jgi:hypothetical protein